MTNGVYVELDGKIWVRLEKTFPQFTLWKVNNVNLQANYL
jgi:hypothetical protein